jgi:hypothetical protein
LHPLINTESGARRLIFVTLRDMLKQRAEFDRRRAVEIYEAAEMLDEREKNLVNELTALALMLIEIPRHPGALVSGDAGFNPPSVTVATLHGNRDPVMPGRLADALP